MSEERKWTDAQRAAFKTRGRTLLVSAAAGSGKTSVLTERIIRAITGARDEDDPNESVEPRKPIELMRILAVTFTRTAARDLREKLGRALREALADAPDDRRLAGELACLPAAHICTIDSFCLDVVKSYSSLLKIPRAFRLADPAEDLLLCTGIMNDLINELYDGTAEDCAVSVEEFSAVADLLTPTKEEAGLADVLLSLWESCNGYPDGTARLTASVEAIAAADFPTDAKGYRDTVLAELDDIVRYFRPIMEAYTAPFAACEPLSVKYLPAAEYAEDFCRHTHTLITAREYGKIREALMDYAPPSISVSPKKLTPDEIELADRFKSDRKALTEAISDLSKRYFSYSAENMISLRGPLTSTLKVIATILDTYGERLETERRLRGVLSFSDLEHLTLDLLRDEDGSRSSVAKEIASRFDLVFVDEYQDVNPIQHSIFTLISQPDNLFMVGDVKQSIYSFRGAAPEVFTSLRKSFRPLDKTVPEGEPAAIDMSSNFRSDLGVINFVNLLFDRAFTLFAEKSGYIPERDRLVYGKQPPKTLEESAKTVFAVFSKKKNDVFGDDSGNADEHVAAPTEGDEVEGEEIEQTSPIGETEFVCDEIRRLIRKEGYKKGDFAILVRDGKQLSRFALALAEEGLDTDTSSDDDFFSSPEILLALCLLNSVDNPRRDTYLAGLMMSPLFGFSADDLVRIRIDGSEMSGETLWEALRQYTEKHPEYDRGVRFIERLEYFRRISEGLPSDELIWRLYEESGFFAAVGGESGGTRERLLRLYDWARAFERGSYHGLWHFISYINELIEKKKLPGEGKSSSGGDCVHIITSHSSKGLEFPVCFVCGCDVPYNFRSLRKNTVFNGELGAMLRLRTEDGLALIDNPYRNIAIDRIKRDQREEELRLLYVALTRARERLYVCASPTAGKRLGKTMERLVAGECPPFPATPYMIYTANSPFDVMAALLPYADGEERKCFEVRDLRFVTREELAEENRITETSPPPVATRELTEEEALEVDRLSGEFSRRLGFVYPGEALTELPKKLPVSALREDLLDRAAQEMPTESETGVSETAEEMVDADTETAPPLHHIPRFMGGAEEGASALRGIATHLFMQFCDFARLEHDGVDTEIERLVADGFISAQDAARIRRDELRRFRESRLFAELLATREHHRELRFNINIPAADLTRDPDKARALDGQLLLVQGVIDCVYTNSAGELVLVDYKTDRPPHRGASRAEIEAALLDRHTDQLAYYRRACRAIFGREPTRTLIYSLYLGDTVEVTPK